MDSEKKVAKARSSKATSIANSGTHSTSASRSVRADELFESLKSSHKEPDTQPSKPGRLDDEIKKIYEQAHTHRDKLLSFFIWYTIIFSFFVLCLIFLQAHARAVVVDAETIELVPQWALHLLVLGMFAQFVGLLTIVTRKVWTFDPFFKQYNDSSRRSSEDVV